jgi:hypothetical protein
MWSSVLYRILLWKSHAFFGQIEIRHAGSIDKRNSYTIADHVERIDSSAINTTHNPTRAGWILKQPAEIGRALSDDFDGTVLNPFGIEIDLSFWVFKQLKKLHLLERDRETCQRRIFECVFGLMELWDGHDFRPDRKFRALDPGYQGACSKDSAYASSFLKALGRDCSGLAAPGIERTHNYESDLDHSRLSDKYRRVKIEELLNTVKAKRRIS